MEIQVRNFVKCNSTSVFNKQNETEGVCKIRIDSIWKSFSGNDSDISFPCETTAHFYQGTLISRICQLAIRFYCIISLTVNSK